MNERINEIQDGGAMNTTDPEYAARKWLTDSPAEEADTVLDLLDELTRRRQSSLRPGDPVEVHAGSGWITGLVKSLGNAHGRPVVVAALPPRRVNRELLEAQFKQAMDNSARNPHKWRKMLDYVVDSCADSLDALLMGECCASHTFTCEPPSELCCDACTEDAHPDHADGSPCVLDRLGPAAHPGTGADQ